MIEIICLLLFSTCKKLSTDFRDENHYFEPKKNVENGSSKFLQKKRL